MTNASLTTPNSTTATVNSGGLDVLLFTNGFTLFGLPSSHVLEILYPHPVTPLPFVSPAIDGLINVEGRIAVQVNLGTLTDFPSGSARNEVLLLDTGRALCALKVDSVLSRASLPHSESTTTLPDNLTPALLELAVGCKRWMGNTVVMLDPAKLGRLVRPEGLSEEGTGILGKVLNDDTRADNASTHCLVVETAGERYALPMTHVVEIVQGGVCTPIPGAPPAIQGLFLLREDVILVIDLATRLGQQRQEQQQDNNQDHWIVVIDHEMGRCGFAFDQILEIEHLANAGFQAGADKESLVKGVFVSNNTHTLLLHVETLVDDQIRTILATHHRALPGRQQEQAETSLRFLQVGICSTPYAIAVDTVKRVTPCFPMESTLDTSGRIRGAIDLDGEIIPVLELAFGLSLPHAVPEREYVVISDGEHDWAIGVDNASRIVSVPLTQVNRLAQSDVRYVGGVVQIDEQLVSLLDFSVLSAQPADTGDHG